MNRRPDWYAQRIEDEVKFFMGQVEQERTLGAQATKKAIAKAQGDSRKHADGYAVGMQKVVIKKS